MKTIKSKLLMALVIPVIMVALCPIIIFIVSNINQINTAGYRSASAVLKSTTDNFDSWMSIKKNILLGYYNLDINELKSIVRSKLPINVEKVYDLYYGDVDGKTYGGLDSPEDYIAQGYDPRKRPWYIDSKAKTGEILVSEPYVDETTNDLVLTFSKAYNTTDKGVLALDISIDDIKKVVNNITLPVEGHAFLVYDEDNKIIASSIKEDLLDKPLDSVYPELNPEAVNRIITNESKNKSFTSISTKNAGDVFLLATRLKEAPWKMVVILDKSTYYRAAYLDIAISIIITILVIIGIIVYINRAVQTNITRPVHHVGRTLKALAAKEADFDNKINITSNDEIGELAANFNHFLDNQKKLFSEINGFLKTSTEDSIASNNEIYSRINEQQNELNEVMSSVAEINSSIANIHQCIGETVEVANNISDASKEGMEMVQKSNFSIRELSESIRQTNDAIAAVSEHATSIVSVVATIKSIAEQTNLLALNAAIESARAGEHGRGFAVVADEVRGLSIKTSESIQVVQESIKTLQTNVDTTVSLMKQSIEDCDSSLECVDSMNNAIHTIISTVDRINSSTETIRNATAHQTQMIENTNKMISKVNSSNAMLIRTVEENKERSRELQETSESITSEINIE